MYGLENSHENCGENLLSLYSFYQILVVLCFASLSFVDFLERKKKAI